MKRIVISLLSLTAVALGDTKRPNELKMWFPDGTGVAVHTESSAANSPLSTSGSVVVGTGSASHRVVVDKQGRIIFAYDIEARRSGTDEFTLRIKPIDQAKIRTESWFPKDKVSGDVATLSAYRDFPPLKSDDAVQVDILMNSVTSERIYDVLRMLNEPPPRHATAKVAAGSKFSFEKVQVAINGKSVHEPQNTWMIGAAMRIFLPGRGAYYLSLSAPTMPGFQASGWADRNVLRFHAGSDLVEVVAQSNILQKSEFGTVWIYHDPKPADKSNTVDFQCADDLESMMGRNLGPSSLRNDEE